MRLWLLLRRRRRLLTVVATSCLAFILISSFWLPGNAGQNSLDAFDNADYDLNYDSVDAVHAMVRQMSSVKRRTQLQFDDEQEQDTQDKATHDKDTYLKFEPLDPKTHEIHRKKKIRLGIGDYPDIPDDVPKKYSFIHEQQKPTMPNTRAPPPEHQAEEIQVKPEYKEFNNEVQSEDQNDVKENAKEHEMREDDRLDNAEEEDSYDADYKDDEKEENIIEARDDENEQYDEEEYDYGNRNPVFKQGDFDPMPANASKKKTFQFEELADEDQQNKLQYDEDDGGVNYEDNDRDNDAAHVAQHDTRVNGRMLHSKLSAVLDDAPKDTGGHNQRDIYDNHKALTRDITRLHTPKKRLENNGIHANQRHLPLDTRKPNSHNEYSSSNVRQHFNVPNVDAKLKENLLQNVIQTPFSQQIFLVPKRKINPVTWSSSRITCHANPDPQATQTIGSSCVQ